MSIFDYCFQISGKNDDDDDHMDNSNDVESKVINSSSSVSKSSSSYLSCKIPSFFRQERILSAIFYGVSSLGVIFVNKCILTQYDFPYFNFLATIQFIVTTIILTALIYTKKIDIPILNRQIVEEVLPISIMFLGNVISGLGSTKSLNLPMLTVLRRFSILMTMIGEFIILGNKASTPIVISVGLMIGGAVIAAIYDFSYNPSGYVLVLLNNLFTALNGIWLKKASMSGKCNKLGILYYNSLFSAIAMIAYFIAEDVYVMNKGGLSYLYTPSTSRHLFSQLPDPMSMHSKIVHTSNEVHDPTNPSMQQPSIHQSTFHKITLYDNWTDFNFLFLFLFASCCGSILNYATFLCTSYNSALTTSVIGCLKNVATSYIGMILFHDYHFNWINFVGVNISIAGSLYYTYVTLFKGIAGFGSG